MGKIKGMDTSMEVPETIHEMPILNAPSDSKADTVIHERNEEQVKQDQSKKPTDVKTVGQVIAGTAGLIIGVIAGAFIGTFLGALLAVIMDAGQAGWALALLGSIIGAPIGGITLSSYFIYATANKKKGRGTYLSTLGGVTLGAALSILFPPLLLVLPALIGTYYYNKSIKAPAEVPVKKKNSEW
jgi:tetrahydromethanopterin S-methyltransferase subunit F